jgi:hypothetical protein
MEVCGTSIRVWHFLLPLVLSSSIDIRTLLLNGPYLSETALITTKKKRIINFWEGPPALVNDIFCAGVKWYSI